MKKTLPYSDVPAGYFESLGERLSMIPEAASRRRRRNARAGVLALCSIAAAAALALVLVPSRSSAPTNEQIIEYLIDSGLTAAQLYELY